MSNMSDCGVGRRRGLSITFANVLGLRSNLAFVEHHLTTPRPNLSLLSETQLEWDSFSSNLNVSNCNFFHNFRLNGGVGAYININTPVTHLVNLESPNFDVSWLKICLPTSTIILCFCYCSSNGTDFPVLFQYLTTSHETDTSSNPNAELLYLGDFNVHHTEWLGFSYTDTGGREAKSFRILNDQEQRFPTFFSLRTLP
ncbi:UNVERIFIED_CONTAM: hypothetical protein RMT77_017072 [Armadillidium vulgare]